MDLFLSFYFINPPNIDIVTFNNPIDLPLVYSVMFNIKKKLKTLNIQKSTSQQPPNLLSCLFFIIAWPKDKKETSNEIQIWIVWINHKNLLYCLIYGVSKLECWGRSEYVLGLLFVHLVMSNQKLRILSCYWL